MTMVERKTTYNELKCKLKELWTTEMVTSTKKEDGIIFPSHFKKYKNDGLKDAKKIDLVEEGEEPKLAWIATDLDIEGEEILIQTL